MGVDMHVREDALTESPAPVALCSNSLRPSAAGFEISPLTFVFSVFQFRQPLTLPIYPARLPLVSQTNWDAILARTVDREPSSYHRTSTTLMDIDKAILISVGGSAWSEEEPDTTFTAWFKNNFGASPNTWPQGLPQDIDQRVNQQEEFVTAAGHRQCINPLCKPLSALDGDAIKKLQNVEPTSAGVINLSMREVPWQLHTGAEHVDTRQPKLWMVRRISGEFRPPQVMRSHLLRTACRPTTILCRFSNAADARRLLLDIARTLSVELGKPAALETRLKLTTLRDLLFTTVLESERTTAKNQTSTHSNLAKPGCNIRMHGSPAAVVASGCVCANLESFPAWLHDECAGSRSFVVSPNTSNFSTEQEVIPTAMHAMKCGLLSNMRTHRVSRKNILRVRISDAEADVLTGVFQSRSTDKHKLMWLVPTHCVRALTHLLQPDLCKGQGSIAHETKTTAESPTPGGKDTQGRGQDETQMENALTCYFSKLLDKHESVEPLTHRVWEYGSLHITTSDPTYQGGRWRLRFSPSMSGPHFGDFICIIMDWVGNYIFYHECLRRAAKSGLHSGPLVKMFVPHAVVTTKNALQGLLPEPVLALYEEKVGFKLDLHQRRALQYLNDASDSAFFVQAFAGVGKSAVSSVIQFACSIRYKEDSMNHADSCVVVLCPGPELREGFAQEALLQAALRPEQVMLLGKPASATSTLPTWDERAANFIKIQLESNGVLQTLQALQTELIVALGKMRASAAAINPDLQWNFMECFLGQGPAASACADAYLKFSSSAKRAAQIYVLSVVNDRIKTHGPMVAELVKSVTVVISTCDAWCKLHAKRSSWLSKAAMSQKKVQVLIMDDAQRYTVPAVLAACHMAETVVFLGDENQSVDVVPPHYTRTPWVSLDDPLSLCQEELDTVDHGIVGLAGARGSRKEPSSGAWESSAPGKRCWFTEFFAGQQILELAECKRCGPEVTRFCCRMFKWCKDAGYNSSECAPNTKLYHYFYDTTWEDWRVDAMPMVVLGVAKHPATWNSCLFCVFPSWLSPLLSSECSSRQQTSGP